jgi:hypothetical protein
MSGCPSNTIIDLVHYDNIRYLRPALYKQTKGLSTPGSSYYNRTIHRAPKLMIADGKVFVGDMLGAVFAEAFHDPSMYSTVQTLVTGCTIPTRVRSKPKPSPVSPSSSVSHYDTVPTAVAETPIQASIAGTTGVDVAAAWSTVPAVNPLPSVVDGDEEEAHEGDDLFEEQPGLVELMLVDIPPSFVGHLYIEVVREVLLNYSWVPLGLYRGKETHDSPLPYVFTNPPPSTVIGPGDTLYVIFFGFCFPRIAFFAYSLFECLASWQLGFELMTPFRFLASKLFGLFGFLFWVTWRSIFWLFWFRHVACLIFGIVQRTFFYTIIQNVPCRYAIINTRQQAELEELQEVMLQGRFCQSENFKTCLHPNML